MTSKPAGGGLWTARKPLTGLAPGTSLQRLPGSGRLRLPNGNLCCSNIRLRILTCDLAWQPEKGAPQYQNPRLSRGQVPLVEPGAGNAASKRWLLGYCVGDIIWLGDIVRHQAGQVGALHCRLAKLRPHPARPGPDELSSAR